MVKRKEVKLKPPQPETYKYYALLHPLVNFNHPVTGNGTPLHMQNYACRRHVEDGRFRAWGELVYAKPLDEREMEVYGLAPARDNPDLRQRMETQTQIVGELEDAVPLEKRITWWDFGEKKFYLHEYITPEQLEARLEALQVAQTP